MADYDMSIHANPDAMAWAEFFCKTTRDMPREVFDDAGYMVSWFANAMMAMHDHMNGESPLNGDHAQYLIDNAPPTPAPTKGESAELIAEARAVLFQEHGEASEFSVFARLTTALEAAEARAVEAERALDESQKGAFDMLESAERQLAAAREAMENSIKRLASAGDIDGALNVLRAALSDAPAPKGGDHE